MVENAVDKGCKRRAIHPVLQTDISRRFSLLSS